MHADSRRAEHVDGCLDHASCISWCFLSVVKCMHPFTAVTVPPSAPACCSAYCAVAHAQVCVCMCAWELSVLLESFCFRHAQSCLPLMQHYIHHMPRQAEHMCGKKITTDSRVGLSRQQGWVPKISLHVLRQRLHSICEQTWQLQAQLTQT